MQTKRIFLMIAEQMDLRYEQQQTTKGEKVEMWSRHYSTLRASFESSVRLGHGRRELWSVRMLCRELTISVSIVVFVLEFESRTRPETHHFWELWLTTFWPFFVCTAVCSTGMILSSGCLEEGHCAIGFIWMFRRLERVFVDDSGRHGG